MGKKNKQPGSPQNSIVVNGWLHGYPQGKKEGLFTLWDGCQYFDQKQRFPSLVVHAFYSAWSRNVTIDNNKYHDNYMYTIDPHSSTSDMSTTNKQLLCSSQQI
jgi:hypothetical protein